MDDVRNVLENFSEEEFQKKYGKPKPAKDTKMIFSCRSGRRSANVQKTVQKLGYTQYDISLEFLLKIYTRILHLFIL